MNTTQTNAEQTTASQTHHKKQIKRKRNSTKNMYDKKNKERTKTITKKK